MVLLLAALSCLTSARALTFNVTYDASVTTNANSAQIQSAFATACAMLTNQFTNAITINLTVYWGNTGPFTGGIGLGANYTSFNGYFTYAQVTNALRSHRISSSDFSSVASLPASDPIAGDEWLVPTAQIKVLGLPGIGPNDPAEDSAIGFASTVSYTFDPANRAVSGKYDFIGVALHEITEAMGRSYGLDTTPGNPFLIPNDLFRFTASGVRNFSTTATAVYFSVDNGTNVIKYYNSNPGGDLQDWTNSTPRDSCDAFVPSGVQLVFSNADVTAVDILGYNMPAAPSVTPPVISGAVLSNGLFQISFSNSAAATFSVVAATNLALPASNWTVLGAATQLSAGNFRFNDAPATNRLKFYRVRSP